MKVGENPLQIARLKALRESRGWSQRELARLCGMGEAQIGKYENGQNEPTASSLKVMADKLDVSVDYLLGISDQPHRIDTTQLASEEYLVLDAFRRDGWRGVVQLGVEHLSN